MIYYGYITDLNDFDQQEEDIIWQFDRYNEDQTTTEYNCIKTLRDLGENPYAVMYEDKESFNNWRKQYAPVL